MTCAHDESLSSLLDKASVDASVSLSSLLVKASAQDSSAAKSLMLQNTSMRTRMSRLSAAAVAQIASARVEDPAASAAASGPEGDENSSPFALSPPPSPPPRTAAAPPAAAAQRAFSGFAGKTLDEVWRSIDAGPEAAPPPSFAELLAMKSTAQEAEPPRRGNTTDLFRELAAALASRDPAAVAEARAEAATIARANRKRKLYDRALRLKNELKKPLDEAAARAQERLLKNRESAERSRLRRRAYCSQLEMEANALKRENAALVERLAKAKAAEAAAARAERETAAEWLLRLKGEGGASPRGSFKRRRIAAGGGAAGLAGAAGSLGAQQQRRRFTRQATM